MILKILSMIALVPLCGLLYRMGGAAKTGKWYDFMLNTKTRDFGVPTCLVALFLAWTWPGWDITLLSLILTWGAVFGAQTTYWKRGPNSRWYNWLFTGMGYAAAWVLTVVAQNIPGHVPGGIHATWLGFGCRFIVLSGITVMVSEIFGNAVWEENARGAAEAFTLPLLFIGS